MIRPKLILAFVGMAVMTAICGLVGYAFVDRIWASVSVFSDVTSPLLVESMALADNAQRLRAASRLGDATVEEIDRVAQRIAALQVAGSAHLSKLRQLVSYPGIALDLDATANRQREFIELMQRMLESRRRELKAVADTSGRSRRFNDLRQVLQADLIALIKGAEGKINKIEDETKVTVQTGTATVEVLGDLVSDLITQTYPVVHNATRLQHENEQLDEIVKALLVQFDVSAVAALENDTRTNFKLITSVLRSLAGRLRDAEGKAVVAKIQTDLAALETALFAADGLFAGQLDVLTAQAEIAGDRAEFNAAEGRYLSVLDDVLKAVNTVNQSARQNASDDIVTGRTVIATSVLLTLLAGLGFGWLFAYRITTPLTQLAEHTAAIGKTGELMPLPDQAMVARADEFGILSRAFNLMITELTTARQRLIDWSEAEVRIQYERLNAAINNMPQGLCMFDAQQKLIVCNRRYAEIYALNPALALPGTSLRAVLQDHVAKSTSPDRGDDYVVQRLAAVAENKPFYFINEMRDGHVIAISHQPLSNGGSIATHEDITERRKAEAKIVYMAHHDALTGLPNRTSFGEEMDKALAQIAREGQFAVLCLDLDHFKDVNDTLGHPIGDALLQEVASRIKACLRPGDTIARLGGDEFAIVQGAAEQPVGATALAARLIKDMSVPFDIRGHQVVIGASVGIAIAPNDGSDHDRLLRNADMALYRAKEDGRGAYRFFEPEMDAKMQLRRVLELDLRRAVAVGEFELFYQPVLTLETRAVASFEALLRWRHPQRGLISPADFIPFMEEIGLINVVGTWVLKEACREAMKWPSEITVSVNLSPIQFKSGTLVLDVISALGAAGLPAARLELEITETILLQDTDATVATLNQLRKLGVRIAMDDFGIGYSSLGYLRKFPFDKIKIDRSFIHDLSEKPDSIAIVRAVAGLGVTLGMKTTAEGVETEEQLLRLVNEGCTEVQGFLFSKPVPARELDQLLQRLAPQSKAVA